MRKLFLPLLMVILLAVGLGGGYFAGQYLRPPPAKPSAPPPDEHKAPDADLLYDLPDILVALAGDPDPTRVLSLTISLQCPSQDDLGKLQEYLPRVLDAYQSYLRTLSVADLRGTEHLNAVKAKLLERVDAVIAPGKVSAVLLRSLTIR